VGRRGEVGGKRKQRVKPPACPTRERLTRHRNTAWLSPQAIAVTLFADSHRPSKPVRPNMRSAWRVVMAPPRTSSACDSFKPTRTAHTEKERTRERERAGARSRLRCACKDCPHCPQATKARGNISRGRNTKCQKGSGTTNHGASVKHQALIIGGNVLRISSRNSMTSHPTSLPMGHDVAKGHVGPSVVRSGRSPDLGTVVSVGSQTDLN
jgi:hypothetical protein